MGELAMFVIIFAFGAQAVGTILMLLLGLMEFVCWACGWVWRQLCRTN